MELQVLLWLAAHRTPALDGVMILASAVGWGGIPWMIAAIARGALYPRLRMAAWQVALVVLLAWVTNDVVLKPTIRRPRPFRVSAELRTLGPRPSDFSMPSGHTAEVVAGACALGQVWPAARAASWAFAALVAFSRLYLGVHYPTDVLAGALVGWLVGGFVMGGTRWRAALSRRT